MVKILNALFSFLKILLLVISFGLCFFIVLSMYNRVGKNMISSIPIFIPFVLLLTFYTINFCYKQKYITQNLFYNITSCVALLVVCFVCYRSIFDKNMILNELMGYGVNFSYFNDFIPFMKVMIYGLVISNLFFIIGKEKNKKKKSIATKVEVL